ncbi:hypothetical protein DFH27DRAFT_567386 [Peziza echinospora]|nr:hypothetical protein DFH27DRAFT_567386 [Peziza echinospora]
MNWLVGWLVSWVVNIEFFCLLFLSFFLSFRRIFTLIWIGYTYMSCGHGGARVSLIICASTVVLAIGLLLHNYCHLTSISRSKSDTESSTAPLVFTGFLLL